MQEIWKDIKGFEGLYQVSNMGNVRSLPRVVEHPPAVRTRNGVEHIVPAHTQTIKGRILKPVPNSKGYLRVGLQKDGEAHRLFVHRLVAEAFLPNPDNKPQVNHKNGDKTDNRVENLEWVDNSENQKHGRKEGLIRTLRGEEKPHSKLTEEDVRWIRENYKEGVRGLGMKALAKKFGVSPQTIKDILQGKKWKHVQQ